MLSIKGMITYSLVGILLSFSFHVSGMAPVKNKQEAGKPPKAVNHTIKRTTEFMQKIEGNVLHTENNQYSLNGVRILDHRKDKEMTPTTQGKKKIVEMTFFDDRLQQVVIH
jgi:hypothetical protein